MSEVRYTQKATIGDNEVDVQRHEVWAEDWAWNRFKFIMFIIGSILVLLAFWTHGFGFFGGEQQVNKPSVTVIMPSPTVVTPVVVQSPAPVVPIPTTAKLPVRSAPKPASVAKPNVGIPKEVIEELAGDLSALQKQLLEAQKTVIPKPVETPPRPEAPKLYW